MLPLAVIGGSSFLASPYFKDFTQAIVQTPYGRCLVRHNQNKTVYFIQRHAADPAHSYSPPHLINKKSIIYALKQLGVERIIAFGSVGSLKKSLTVGTIVIPDDFACSEPISFYGHQTDGHVVPQFDIELRDEIIAVLLQSKVLTHPPVTSASYMQTLGPRFETQTEIKQLALVGEIVGMTCAHEAILAQELKMCYSLICVCDNYANGVINERQLKTEEFHAGIKQNLTMMERILGVMLNHFEPKYLENGLIPNRLSDQRLKVDLIVSAKHIVQVRPATTLHDHSLVIQNGRILAIEPTASVLTKFDALVREEHPRAALLPGFVNAHTHVGMSLFRGYADDYKLHQWLTEHLWPAESEFVSEEFTRVGTEIGLSEMIRCGTTTINDMYWFPEVIAEMVKKVGMRATIGLIVIDFPTAYANSADEYFEKGRKLRAKYAGDNLLRFALAPHAPYTVCDDHLSQLNKMAQDAKLLRDKPNFSGDRVHIHLHETKAEVESSEKGDKSSRSCHRSDETCRPLKNLDRLGMVNDQLVAIHMTTLNDDDIDLLSQKKSHVVHCPSSNMKLASGFCPVAQLLDKNINVALGTDSTASNNKLDILGEARLAALLAKGINHDASVVSAQKALEMATINGAKALGIDDETGSLEVGKSADFVVLQIEDIIECEPIYDVVSHIIYTADRTQISDVWCNGVKLMSNRHLLTIDENKTKKDIKEWQTKITKFRNEQRLNPKKEQTEVYTSIEAPADDSPLNVQHPEHKTNGKS